MIFHIGPKKILINYTIMSGGIVDASFLLLMLCGSFILAQRQDLDVLSSSKTLPDDRSRGPTEYQSPSSSLNGGTCDRWWSRGGGASQSS
jgi:hypothetical protein